MTSILNKNNCLKLIKLLIIAALAVLPVFAFAQNALSLSVTPTLVQMAGQPNQLWESQIKVINSNKFPITIYAEVANFAPQGESGHGRLIPIFEEITEGTTLAEWISIDNAPIEIPREQSVTIPFTVNVPENADPGGHFAAILVSTQPPVLEDKLTLKTSQIVTSLFFVRIAGDVIEEGSIRSFSVADKFVETPEIDFSLRFQNQGNVQLQPQGQVTIYNMWGKKRGTIPINTQTHFGNVLPNSVRKFEFSWEGEQTVSDIGRYKAEASLAYGFDTKKFETQELYFWVVPLKPMLLTLATIIAIVWLLIWMVRSYVRRMLSLAGLDPDRVNLPTRKIGQGSKIIYEGDVTIEKSSNSISAPLRFGFSDLKDRLKQAGAYVETIKILFGFIISYKKFFFSVVILLLIFIALVAYLKTVNVEERDYTVSIDNPDQAMVLNSEEVHLQNLTAGSLEEYIDDEQKFELSVVNVSDIPGTAAEVAYRLMQQGYRIDSVSSDKNRLEDNSVVVFDAVVQDEALAISQILNGALPSFAPARSGSSTPMITIFAGKNLSKASD